MSLKRVEDTMQASGFTAWRFGERCFERACRLGLEGIVSKRLDAPPRAVFQEENEQNRRTLIRHRPDQVWWRPPERVIISLLFTAVRQRRAQRAATRQAVF